MEHQGARHPFLLAHGQKPRLVCAEWSDGTPSPDTKSWLTDTSDFSQRPSSKSPSLYSVPSTCSTQDFPPSPPNPSLQLPQVPIVPSIRHRTPQACDKCRQRKTKCSGHRPTCLRCNSRGLSCNYSPRETRIRGSLRPRTLVQAFDNRPLFSRVVEGRAHPYGFPTPAHHSRMGSFHTTAFIRSPDDNPKVPTMPVGAPLPLAGRHYFDWDQLGDPVPSPVPISFRRSTWPRSFLCASSVDRTRKPHAGASSRLDDYSYHVPQTNSAIHPEIDFDYLNPRSDADHLPSSMGVGGDRVFEPSEGRGAVDFNEGPFSSVVVEDFSTRGLPSFQTPHYTFDTPFLNGLENFY